VNAPLHRSTPSVVIIGAGPGGLASALLLAQAGFRVRVVERQSFVGGRTSALNVEGFRFDRGPTFFLYPRILQEIFASVGRDLFKEVPMTRLDPQYRLMFGGGRGELMATPDVERLKDGVRALCPRDAEQVESFLAHNRNKLEQFSPVLESRFQSWKKLFSRQMLSLLPLLRPHLSLDEELKRHFSDERIRLAFSFQSKYLGMSPFQCPSLFSILSFLEYEHGVFHPTGGCSRVSERMGEIAREMGVEVQLEEPVRQIRFIGRRVTGVVTDRASYDCDALVINADFASAASNLIPDHLRPSWTDKKLKKAQYSCSTFMLYLGLRGVSQVPHHTIYFSSDYRRNLNDITRDHRISEDPSIYVQNAGVTDSTLAPEGCSTLYVLVPVSHQNPNIDWRVEAPKLRETALQQLEKVGIENVRERILVERSCTPNDWEAMQIYRGATFSMAHTLKQMLHLRPRNHFDDLDGVYLTGGGTHPGSGLPVIYSSARITSELICEHHGRVYA
jgi:phytoene desaturase